jgi:hypothetical protein
VNSSNGLHPHLETGFGPGESLISSVFPLALARRGFLEGKADTFRALVVWWCRGVKHTLGSE